MENPHGMFAQSRRGRAWRGCPKPRRRSWLRKQSAQALQTAIKTRVISTGRRGGPSWTTCAFGETPERRLWAIQCEDRRACPAHQMGSFADQLPQRRTGAIKESLHPATLASRIVILAYRFGDSRFRSGRAGAALGDVQVPLLVASLQLAIQA